jgi:hypothetical protein
MANAIHVYIQDKQTKQIAVEHIFYGRTEAEADAARLAHLARCENYAAAEVDGRTIEFGEGIRDIELPDWDELAADDADEDEEEGTDVIDIESDEGG